MSYSSRVYRQRNAHIHDNDANKEQNSFFSKSDDQASAKGSKPSFFQAKLSVGQPNDKYEQEADAVANSVVNHRQGNTPVVQQKEISSIQRYATPMEDEKFSTNDERMKHDKEIQEKPEVQMMCAGCEKEDKEKKGAVQKKADGGGTASPKLSSKIESASGKGKTLPRNTLAEMNNSFGVDFSKVNIHTDSESAQMNKELGAQAFTHGNDIYFNSGKYNSNTAEGKQLLAHELTHVVQQGYAPEEKQVQRDLLDDLNPFKEEDESVAGAVADVKEGAQAGAGNNQQNILGGTDLLGGLGDVIPLSLPAWKTDFLSVTILSRDAVCIGSATPTNMLPMSLCNALHFCTKPATFNFNLFFHFDVEGIPRPKPFTDANVSIGIDFTPDGQTNPSFSKHQSGKGIYAGPGVPLTTPFGNAFSFTTSKDGTLSVVAKMTDAASGITVTYIDNIRCKITSCDVS
jgi:Domain of unknown function (DUF4157)